jgi:hypothetical protein
MRGVAISFVAPMRVEPRGGGRCFARTVLASTFREWSGVTLDASLARRFYESASRLSR